MEKSHKFVFLPTWFGDVFIEWPHLHKVHKCIAGVSRRFVTIYICIVPTTKCFSSVGEEAYRSLVIVVEETPITVVVHICNSFCLIILFLLPLECTLFVYYQFTGVRTLELWSPRFRTLWHCHFGRFDIIVLVRLFTGFLFHEIIHFLLLCLLVLTAAHRAHGVLEVASDFVQNVFVINWISSPFLHVIAFIFSSPLT